MPRDLLRLCADLVDLGTLISLQPQRLHSYSGRNRKSRGRLEGVAASDNNISTAWETDWTVGRRKDHRLILVSGRLVAAVALVRGGLGLALGNCLGWRKWTNKEMIWQDASGKHSPIFDKRADEVGGVGSNRVNCSTTPGSCDCSNSTPAADDILYGIERRQSLRNATLSAPVSLPSTIRC